MLPAAESPANYLENISMFGTIAPHPVHYSVAGLHILFGRLQRRVLWARIVASGTLNAYANGPGWHRSRSAPTH
jgi:hypothetical protein